VKQVRPDRQPLIQVKKLSKLYRVGDEVVRALNNVSAQVMRGEICCIFGTSGSGKSTLLNQLAGLEKPSRGEVTIGGASISRMNEDQLARFRQRHLGFIFQSYNLLPHLTALENVELPLVFCGMERASRRRAAMAMLHRVGLAHRLNHYPGQMSGGQQQRVGIARAFVNRPAVIFADEPTGNLDTKTTQEVMAMMQRFAHTYQETIILVSHDPGIKTYADRVITLKDGEVISNTVRETSNEENEAHHPDPDHPGDGDSPAAGDARGDGGGTAPGADDGAGSGTDARADGRADTGTDGRADTGADTGTDGRADSRANG
jgi:putative ABC transport system ATP-binding protein